MTVKLAFKLINDLCLYFCVVFVKFLFFITRDQSYKDGYCYPMYNAFLTLVKILENLRISLINKTKLQTEILNNDLG